MTRRFTIQIEYGTLMAKEAVRSVDAISTHNYEPPHIHNRGQRCSVPRCAWGRSRST